MGRLREALQTRAQNAGSIGSMEWKALFPLETNFSLEGGDSRVMGKRSCQMTRRRCRPMHLLDVHHLKSDPLAREVKIEN